MLDNFIPAFDMNEQRERDAIKNIEGQIDVVRTAIDNRMNFIIEDSEEAKAITGSSEFGTEKLLIDLGIKEGLFGRGCVDCLEFTPTLSLNYPHLQ